MNQERLREHWLKLISIPSVLPSEKALGDYLTQYLTAMGLSVETSWIGPTSPCLVATLKGSLGEGPSLLLTGHMDTIPVVDGWVTDPFSPVVDGDKVYGLGAMDMKGGLAAICESFQTLIEQGAPFRGELKLAFVSDEEGGSRGTYQLIQEGLKADMAIMAECRYHNAAIGFRGRYGVRVVVKGVAAHASLYPQAGVNAIIDAALLAQELEKLPTKVHPQMGGGTCLVRQIEGGTRQTITVADRCEIYFDRYVVPGEDQDFVIGQVRELAERMGIGDRVEVDMVPRSTPYMEPFVIPEDHPLVASLAKAYSQLEQKPLEFEYDPSICDANYLVTLAGIPTVTFGPSGQGLHGPNEYGLWSQVKGATQIYLQVVKDLLG